MLILIKQLKRPFMRPKQDVCRWELKASNCGITLSCTTSQTMIGKCILNRHKSFIIFSNNNISLFMHHYVIACAKLFSFSFQSSQVFSCPIKRIRKGLSHPSHVLPMQEKIGWGKALVCWCWPLMTASTWQGMENLLPFWNQTKKPVSWWTTRIARATSGYDD